MWASLRAAPEGTIDLDPPEDPVVARFLTEAVGDAAAGEKLAAACAGLPRDDVRSLAAAYVFSNSELERIFF